MKNENYPLVRLNAFYNLCLRLDQMDMSLDVKISLHHLLLYFLQPLNSTASVPEGMLCKCLLHCKLSCWMLCSCCYSSV